ncbi:hypothetical protein ACU4GG_35240 [Streptomyces nojiriensis]
MDEASGTCLTAPAPVTTPDTPAGRLHLAPCGDHRVDQAWSLPV